MSVFLGIGLGPIQTGIFLSGAAKGDFSRLVIAEVDENLKNIVNADEGVIRVNIAADDRVYQETISGVEVLNPANENDLSELIDVAANASEIATALPSIKIFPMVAEWLRQGFELQPDRTRFLYTAENHNHAAELLNEAIGNQFPGTHYLNTVVGKMSGVALREECESKGLATLSESADRGHMVEEFNRILISSAPGIESRQVKGLYVKPDLLPFEEAKLYGHNAIHFLLGILGSETGKTFMCELREEKELMQVAEKAFVDESGLALCRKWEGVDELFTPEGFRAYAEDLLKRMTNPFLRDQIDRITRDLPRKLGWDDRMIGTIRLALSQNVEPSELAKAAHLASLKHFGDSPDLIRSGFEDLWPKPWTEEHEAVIKVI